jgi:hypothetical protein
MQEYGVHHSHHRENMQSCIKLPVGMYAFERLQKERLFSAFTAVLRSISGIWG